MIPDGVLRPALRKVGRYIFISFSTTTMVFLRVLFRSRRRVHALCKEGISNGDHLHDGTGLKASLLRALLFSCFPDPRPVHYLLEVHAGSFCPYFDGLTRFMS